MNQPIEEYKQRGCHYWQWRDGYLYERCTRCGRRVDGDAIFTKLDEIVCPNCICDTLNRK